MGFMTHKPAFLTEIMLAVQFPQKGPQACDDIQVISMMQTPSLQRDSIALN